MTRTVGDLLARSARLVPDRAAVIVDGQTSLTFAELHARANAFAHGLRARGIEPGHRVALDLGAADWAHYVVAYVGVLRLGAVALLTAARFPDAELDRIVAGYTVAAVIRGPAQAAGSTSYPVLDATTVEYGQSTDEVEVTVRPEDPAEVIFTSGTTARPRGVVATHANLTGAQSTWPTAVRANQPVAHALPLGSVAAQAVLLSCLGGQHTMVVASRFTVAEFTALAHQHAVTTVCLVPAMGHWLAQAPDAEVTVVPSVKGVSFSGAALPVAALPDLPRVFPNATFFNFYTSTETYPARVATRFDPARPESVGRPVGASAVRVCSPDGAESPPGTVGEIWLRAGNAPPRRLLDDDGEGSPVRDGWTRTGDLGYLDEEGYLYLTGRTADIVIVGGVNVSTGRVEQVLARHAAVAEAAVCGVDHPVLGQILAAFVVPRADTTVRDLREHARQQLARPEVPAIIRIVADLPRNPAGKVVKRDLPALLDTPGEAEFVAPRTEIERRIADVWARVLQLGAVGVTDNFFEIGGDSLAATRIAAALRDELGLDVDTVAVLEAPSIAELAELASTVAPGDQLAASMKG